MSKEGKLIILDRDGVINQDSDDYIKSPEEWTPISGSLEAIAKLNKAGYKVAIATNQSGIARGYYTAKVLDEMHKKMAGLLEELKGKVDHIAYCPHGPNDGCYCRKPSPGMLLEIAKAFSISPEKVIFIGDSISDKNAAQAAKMKFTLVETGKGKRTLRSEKAEGNIIDYPVFASLLDVVKSLLAANKPS